MPLDVSICWREELDSYIDLSTYEVNRQVAHILPEEVVRGVNMLPIRIEADQLYVAATAPLDLPGMDEIRLLTGLKVKPVIVTEEELARAINEQFSVRETAKQTIIDMRLEEMEASEEAVQAETPVLEETPVAVLVNSIVRGAVNDGASDIHLEPQHPEMRVRYRINGTLHDITTIPKHIEPSIISRIKLLADMDITERRRPQDGHITLNVAGRQIDLRVSTILTIKGEKIVIRILDKEKMLIELDELGLSSEQQDICESFIARPHGMILITGPTGSGKTTTLYAILKRLNSISENIVTIENPVEYQMPNINQIQVNPQVDMTFAAALRTIVRQDPDIIMVGEIRDFETADVAIHAALTGHLVLSTLHTNDAPGAIVRLLDMGLQPFLVASAITGVIAQRLLRTICPECRELHRPSQAELRLLNLPDDAETMYARGKGCKSCLNTGYRGRTGLFEVLKVDEDIKGLIMAQAPASEIRGLALKKGMRSLGEVGVEKVLQGVSSVEEVLRAAYIEEDRALGMEQLYHTYERT